MLPPWLTISRQHFSMVRDERSSTAAIHLDRVSALFAIEHCRRAAGCCRHELKSGASSLPAWWVAITDSVPAVGDILGAVNLHLG